jgi:hypothetical protein
MRFDQILEAKFPRKPSAEILTQAEQSGFDSSKLWFHGTRRRFDGFQLPKERGIDELGPGVYLTSIKWLANTWARERGFIVICVVRHGPIFDLATDLDNRQTQAILLKGYIQFQNDRWGESSFDPKTIASTFVHAWQGSRDQQRLANLCLSGAGYIGGFKHDSQIEGQIVVFKPDDVMIVAREGGQRYMSS